MVVLVTGASGQLGQALQAIAPHYPKIVFHFAGSVQADITNRQQILDLFKNIKPQYCINTAAYTAVDKAESEYQQAYDVNVLGVRNLAEACNTTGTTLVHISTDFVFDGQKKIPYTEEDTVNPQGVYGQTKREGEVALAALLPEHYIIRTSWLYSAYGNNFMKTMLRLAAEKPSLGVVNDQTGTPTYAPDLAKAILAIIESGIKAYGIYHYSNEGQATWYEFAKTIFEVNDIAIELNPIPTSAYPTPAQRPAYSVLDKTKIKRTFGLAIPHWHQSLVSNNQQ